MRLLEDGFHGQRSAEDLNGVVFCWSWNRALDVVMNGSKLKEGRFRRDIRKKFFPMRVVMPWPRLPREAVAAPSLAGFKARLDGALSSLVWWKMSLLMAGGLEPDDLQGPFQPKPFHDSMLKLDLGQDLHGSALASSTLS